MHLIIYIVVVAIVIFIAILALLFITRPVFVLQRDPRTGVLIDAVSGGKIVAWSIILMIIVVIVWYLMQMMSARMQQCEMNGIAAEQEL